mmetsp:Transcript_33172/g.76521  ORF Transcript_33172/g.76521 Transcript_33172/m.76521 type:complete len:304 (-) Transcript_33172:36-947(-)
MEPHEGLRDRRPAGIVHGEPFPGPIHAASQKPQLVGDLPAVLLLPFPHLLHERLPSQIVPVLALRLGQHLLHHGLGGDARVIRPGNVHGRPSGHAMPPRQGVLHRARQRMPQMQRPGHVRGRNHHGELFRLGPGRRRRGVAGVEPRPFPVFVPAAFHRGGVVGGEHGEGGHVFLAAGAGGREGGHVGSQGGGVGGGGGGFLLFLLGAGGAPGGGFFFFLFLAFAFGQTFQFLLGEFLFAGGGGGIGSGSGRDGRWDVGGREGSSGVGCQSREFFVVHPGLALGLRLLVCHLYELSLKYVRCGF